MGGAALLLLFGYSSGGTTATGDGPLTAIVARSPLDSVIDRTEMIGIVSRGKTTVEVRQ